MSATFNQINNIWSMMTCVVLLSQCIRKHIDQGLQVKSCYALIRLIFIRIDELFLHILIKFTDNDDKFLGIAT